MGIKKGLVKVYPECKYKATVDKRYTQNFGYKDTAGKDTPRISVQRRGRKGINNLGIKTMQLRYTQNLGKKITLVKVNLEFR